MGAKFLHTHVRTDDAEAVADALSELARSHGFTLAAEDEPCDHEVVVVTDRASPAWTSMYGRFADVSWELSDKLSAHVVVLAIFDGDVLEARLYNDGCEVDAFCSRPDYVDEPARAVKGQPRRGDSVCVEGKSWRDVQRVFKTAASRPEAALVELGDAIGLDARSLFPDRVDLAAPTVRRLRFRDPPARRRRILEGAPAVRPVGLSAVELKASARDHALRLEAASEGGGSAGVAIAIGGPAIASGLLAVEAVDFRGVTSALREGEREEAGRGRWLVAEIRSAGLPAASAVVDEPGGPPAAADYCPPVLLILTVQALRTGEAELHVRWTPIEPTAAGCLQTVPIRVVA